MARLRVRVRAPVRAFGRVGWYRRRCERRAISRAEGERPGMVEDEEVVDEDEDEEG